MFNKFFKSSFFKNVFFKKGFYKICFLIFVFSFFINTNITKANTYYTLFCVSGINCAVGTSGGATSSEIV